MSEPVGPGSDKPFTWKCRSGNEIQLPSLATLDPDLGAAEAVANAIESGNELYAMGVHVRFLVASLEPKDAAKIRQIKASEFEAFMTAWAEHSGVSAGELPAS